MRATRFLLPLLIVVTAMATLLAQPQSASKPASSTSTAATTSTHAEEPSMQQSLQEILEEPNPADAYRYDPKGRRDPFQSLIGPAPTLQPGQRPPGPPGFLIDEIKLQGVVKTRQQGLVAMVNGPDNKGYLVKVGDKVLDGEVIRITPASIVFRQEVNDPTRIERFREVVKELSSEAPRK
ncbi:MAG TPA: pilus assembly protein PilP [Thermoanaerobaculia bacterium]|jgi:type IV pilus assembly protein PilP|nr:pilus assembly protein PilP [Thermoanaerobaculia bacterium]